MKKICIVTGTRAEYGLLYWTIRAIANDPAFKLQLCVTGMHLSPEFGLTYKQIEKDGFTIDERVETLLSSDSAAGVSKSIGLGTIGFADAFSRLQPDLVLVLGDRFEILAACVAAMIARIPIAHCHGGEATEGLIDEPIRHSITKMSHLHFTSTEEYRRRVIQLGEQPDRVFNVGALGIENINKLSLLSKTEFEKSIDFKLGKRNMLVTFHPVTLEHASAGEQFRNLLETLDGLPEWHIIFTKPNADTDGRIIIELIDQYVTENRERTVSFISLGQLRYLSALQYMDVVVGNSSSGLIEVPSFAKPTVNIGERQRGRLHGETVIDCDPEVKSISTAIQHALSPEFQTNLLNAKNPYGEGNSSDKIVSVLRTVTFDSILKKKFYDIQ
jgi:GDP/UDP-N,N'-diacetylbacillosamine 2-epimerase (hydrolysing)